MPSLRACLTLVSIALCAGCAPRKRTPPVPPSDIVVAASAKFDSLYRRLAAVPYDTASRGPVLRAIDCLRLQLFYQHGSDATLAAEMRAIDSIVLDDGRRLSDLWGYLNAAIFVRPDSTCVVKRR